jgi:hypothetical protein
MVLRCVCQCWSCRPVHCKYMLPPVNNQRLSAMQVQCKKCSITQNLRWLPILRTRMFASSHSVLGDCGLPSVDTRCDTGAGDV